MGGRGSAARTLTRPRPVTHPDLARIAAAPNATRERLLGGQTAITELVTLPDGRHAVRKSAPPWAEPEDTTFYMDGEVLASRLADAIGAPIARVQRDPSDPHVVWVEHLPGTPAGDIGADMAWKPSDPDLLNSPEAVRIGLLDALTGYQDRATGLITTPGGQLAGFDNGGSWLDAETNRRPSEPHLSETQAPKKHFVDGDRFRSDPPLTGTELRAVRSRIEALRPDFDAAGRRAWLDHSLAVLDQITAHATTSTPDPSR